MAGFLTPSRDDGIFPMTQSYAQAAQAGVHSQVVAFEPDQTFLDRGKERIEKSMAKLVSKGKINQEEADQTLGRIRFTTEVEALKDTDFIIEAGKGLSIVDRCTDYLFCVLTIRMLNFCYSH